MEIISLLYYANEMWPMLPSVYAHLLNTIVLTLIHSVTRMFSSRMHTACLLTVSQHTLGVSTQEDVSAFGPRGVCLEGCLPRGVCLGGVCPGGCLPLVLGVSASGLRGVCL